MPTTKQNKTWEFPKTENYWTNHMGGVSKVLRYYITKVLISASPKIFEGVRNILLMKKSLVLILWVERVQICKVNTVSKNV